MGNPARGSIARAQRSAVVFALLIALAAAGGCGTGSDRAGTSTSAARVASRPLDDRQLAGAAVLRKQDLRAGWTQADATAPARCGGPSRWTVNARATAASPSFHSKYAVVQQNVGVFADERTALGVFRELAGQQARVCFYRALLQGVLANGGRGSVSRPTVIRSEGEPRTLSSTRSVVEADSILGRVSIYADNVRLQVGRLVSVIVMVEVGKPIDEAVYEAVVATLRRRAAGLQRAT